MKSVWDLIESGKFKEACVAADKEVASTHDDFELGNKVIALLHLLRLQEAIDLCKKLVKRDNGQCDSQFIDLGTAYWLKNNKKATIDSWQRGLNRKYTDAAGGVQVPALLYFAAIRTANEGLQKESLRRLKKLSKGKRMSNWPGAIAPFLLGSLSERDYLASITKVRILRKRQVCQANFYLGVKYLAANEFKTAKRFMRVACSQGPYSYLEAEYYLAKHEMKNMNTETYE